MRSRLGHQPRQPIEKELPERRPTWADSRQRRSYEPKYTQSHATWDWNSHCGKSSIFLSPPFYVYPNLGDTCTLSFCLALRINYSILNPYLDDTSYIGPICTTRTFDDTFALFCLYEPSIIFPPPLYESMWCYESSECLSLLTMIEIWGTKQVTGSSAKLEVAFSICIGEYPVSGLANHTV